LESWFLEDNRLDEETIKDTIEMLGRYKDIEGIAGKYMID
jgi:hypothetical protein